MYGESTFTWEYVCGYETREQRKRRLFRRIYALGAVVCIVCRSEERRVGKEW